jgi:hypothetical protein
MSFFLDSPDEQVSDNLQEDGIERDSNLSRLRKHLSRHSPNIIFAFLLLIALVSVIIIQVHPTWGKSPTSTALQSSLTITSNVSRGYLTFNGSKSSDLLSFPTEVHPRQGKNSITLLSPPFRAITCQFSWPNVPSNQGVCSYRSLQGGQLLHPASTDQTLAISLSLSDLPDSFQEQAKQKITSSFSLLSQQTRVPAGQYYAVGKGPKGNVIAQQAASELTASLTVSPDFSRVAPLGLSGLESTAPDEIWYTNVPLTFTWQFKQSSGEVSGTLSQSTGYPVSLTYQSQGFQTITLGGSPNIPSSTDTSSLWPQFICDALSSQAISDLFQPGDLRAHWSTTWQKEQGIEGCLIELTPKDDVLTPSPSTITASVPQLLYRFGVLLAVNPQAEALFTSLPMAPAAEIAVVNK